MHVVWIQPSNPFNVTFCTELNFLTPVPAKNAAFLFITLRLTYILGLILKSGGDFPFDVIQSDVNLQKQVHCGFQTFCIMDMPTTILSGHGILTLNVFPRQCNDGDDISLNGPRHNKTCFWDFRQSEIQTNLLSCRD